MVSSTPSTLDQWLEYFNTTHSKESDLGLERILAVAKRLNALKFSCPIVMVSGTNGKGSCVATLESIYLAAGYKVGVFSSPFLLRVNEQIRINKQNVSDAELCETFRVIDQYRRDISLTSFEFFTLAALKIFQAKNLDVIVLEVGMGGRRDAVNIIDANLAVITNVEIEHAEWLGSNRAAIGAEKAGIFRENAPAIYGESDPPRSVIEYAGKLKIPLYCQNKDFGYHDQGQSFTWHFSDKELERLPLPKLALQNVSVGLMAVELLQNLLPVTKESICKGLMEAKLLGRFQVVRDDPVIKIFDVAHNPAGAKFFANNLLQEIRKGKTEKTCVIRAVFSMLADKDIAGSILPLKEMVDEWYIAPIANNKRAATTEQLALAFAQVGVKNNAQQFPTIKGAYLAALAASGPGNHVIIYGSFRTVAEVFMALPPSLTCFDI